ncbi:MAG: quinol monooxygenase YgiN [Pseudohongiellaceae bacterium]|jgi:quinol monooxygenase YgiN
MIMVQSTFHLLETGKAEVLELMREMVELCLKEKGCFSYEYFAGITKPNQVILLQEWDNAEHLQKHYQTQHMEKFLKNLGQHLEKPVVTQSFVSPDLRVAAVKLSDEAPKPEQTIH